MRIAGMLVPALIALALPAPLLAHDADAVLAVARLQVIAAQLPVAAADAANGNADAFAQIEFLRKRGGELHAKLPAPPPLAFERAWAELDHDASRMLEHKQVVGKTAAAAEDFNAKVPVLNSRLDEVAKILAEHQASAAQVLLAAHLMLLGDRMQRRVQSILAGGGEASISAQGLQRDAAFYRAMLDGLAKGNKDLGIKALDNAPARSIAKDVLEQWDALAPTVSQLVDAAAQIEDVREAAERARLDGSAVLLQTESLLRTL